MWRLLGCGKAKTARVSELGYGKEGKRNLLRLRYCCDTFDVGAVGLETKTSLALKEMWEVSMMTVMVTAVGLRR